MMVIRISSSIANFREKLLKRMKLPEWHWWRNRNDRVIFVGAYHWKDWLRIVWHRRPKKVFFCGSDILALEKSWWRYIISRTKAKFYCENEVEQRKLLEMGINAEIRPMIFDDPNKYPICFKSSKTPHVYISCHKGREREYGIDWIEANAKRFPEIIFHIYGISQPFHEIWYDIYGRIYNKDYVQNRNVVYHGQVLEEQFNKEIKEFQAGLSLNTFAGFSEVLAKSILMGQYPISRINYPAIDCTYLEGVLDHLLDELKYKKHSNINASNWWRKVLQENYRVLKEDWT